MSTKELKTILAKLETIRELGVNVKCTADELRLITHELNKDPYPYVVEHLEDYYYVGYDLGSAGHQR